MRCGVRSSGTARRRLVQSFLERVKAPPLPDSNALALAVALALDGGEVECLALMAFTADAIFLRDDAVARLVAERLDHRVQAQSACWSAPSVAGKGPWTKCWRSSTSFRRDHRFTSLFEKVKASSSGAAERQRLVR